jgi:hypothetical protein
MTHWWSSGKKPLALGVVQQINGGLVGFLPIEMEQKGF